MRIGQLARRLGVTPTEILAFLNTQNVETEAGTNSRLSTDVLAKVINHFAPGKLAEILQAPAEETAAPVTATEPVVEVAEEVMEQAIEQPVAEEVKSESTPEAPVEVIRVAKVELQGLKVLGKIDLPQPKKKETVQEQTEGSEQSQPVPETQPLQQPRRELRKRNERTDRREREWKNPLELKRQQEAHEAERKKQEIAERQKEKRTNHYYSKVKSVPTKAVRRFEEQTVEEDIDTKERPKGLIGRFLYWLRH